MGINLGLVPLPLTVTLAEGGDFVSALVASEDWPVGIGIELRLTGGTEGTVTWPATISGDRADWDVPAADVQEVIDADASAAQLLYSESDGTVLLWGKGIVHVR